MTLATVRNFRKVWNTSSSRSCTSILGSLTTIPLGSRTRPIGRVSARSPRSALARDRMQFKLGYRSFQPEEQAAVRIAGVVNTIPIGNEAAAQAANIQQR